jgi:hypothetical protein
MSTGVIRATVKKIGCQKIGGRDSDLFFGIFSQAVTDAMRPVIYKNGKPVKCGIRDSAVNYINGDMIHLEMIGIDPTWAREQLVKAELSLVIV